MCDDAVDIFLQAMSAHEVTAGFLKACVWDTRLVQQSTELTLTSKDMLLLEFAPLDLAVEGLAASSSCDYEDPLVAEAFDPFDGVVGSDQVLAPRSAIDRAASGLNQRRGYVHVPD